MEGIAFHALVGLREKRLSSDLVVQKETKCWDSDS